MVNSSGQLDTAEFRRFLCSSRNNPINPIKIVPVSFWDQNLNNGLTQRVPEL